MLSNQSGELWYDQGDQMVLCPALVSTMHTGLTTGVSSEFHRNPYEQWKVRAFTHFRDCHNWQSNGNTGKVKPNCKYNPHIAQYEGTARFILTKYLTRSLIYSLRCLYSNYHSLAHSALAPGATLRGLGFSRLSGDATSLTSFTLVLTWIKKNKMAVWHITEMI